MAGWLLEQVQDISGQQALQMLSLVSVRIKKGSENWLADLCKCDR